MSNKAVEKIWEEPVDDSAEENVAEEFRFKPHRLERVQPGIKKIGVHLYLDEDVLTHFQQIAQGEGAPAWQTLVNQALRKAVEQSGVETPTGKATAEIETIVSSEPFVSAVADRIADRVADRLKRKTVKKAA